MGLSSFEANRFNNQFTFSTFFLFSLIKEFWLTLYYEQVFYLI